MKSFPSTFNRGGNSTKYQGKEKPETPSEYNVINDFSQFNNIQSKNLNKGRNVKEFLFKEANISTYNRRWPNKFVFRNKNTNNNKARNGIYFENPGLMPSWMLRSMNMYRFIYDEKMLTKVSLSKSDNDTFELLALSTSVTPSMFNPQFHVQAVGMTRNVPLLFDRRNPTNSNIENIGDCSIKRLVADSLMTNSPLGMAKYRLADFMYCKDLGRVSNNHLITLRKFALPVNDHIFEYTNYNMGGGGMDENGFDTPGDVGRLISWFGTDDNKLEDICKFETQFTWKDITNKIQEISSKEDSPDRGIIGKIANSVNPKYNRYANKYGGVMHNIAHDLGGEIHSSLGKIGENNDFMTLMSADTNKVYTPMNTIQDNTIPEGRLIMKQEFTLNFSYKLRAYENINPKSAFLDLLGNILETTFYRGRYWKGEARLVGPPGNKTAWSKATALIDNAWFKLGGFVKSMAAGTTNFEDILGAISNLASGVVEGAMNFGKSIVEDPKAKAQELLNDLIKFNTVTGFSEGIKAQLKNGLGRPAMYAMDSLIEGDNFGPWHLTVGNPYNPIMAIGNLCLTNSTYQLNGPLGIDDFPSEIKVSCTLRPARSRDITEISKYFTKGLYGLYLPNKIQDISTFYEAKKGIDKNQTYSFKSDSQISKEQQEINQQYLTGIDNNKKNNNAWYEEPKDLWRDAIQSENNYDTSDSSTWIIADSASAKIAITNNTNMPMYEVSRTQIA